MREKGSKIFRQISKVIAYKNVKNQHFDNYIPIRVKFGTVVLKTKQS